MLVADPNKRLTGKQALDHKWFNCLKSKDDLSEIEIDPATIQRLIEFKGESLFKKAALNMLVQLTKEDEVKNLRA